MANKGIDLLKASSSMLTGVGEFAVRYGNLFLLMQEPAATTIDTSPPVPQLAVKYAFVDLMKVVIEAGADSQRFRMTTSPRVSDVSLASGEEAAVAVTMRSGSDNSADPVFVPAETGIEFDQKPFRQAVLIEVRYVFNPNAGPGTKAYPDDGGIAAAEFDLSAPPGGAATKVPTTFVLWPKKYWGEV